MYILFTDFWQFDAVFVVAILGCCKSKIYICLAHAIFVPSLYFGHFSCVILFIFEIPFCLSCLAK